MIGVPLIRSIINNSKSPHKIWQRVYHDLEAEWNILFCWCQSEGQTRAYTINTEWRNVINFSTYKGWVEREHWHKWLIKSICFSSCCNVNSAMFTGLRMDLYTVGYINLLPSSQLHSTNLAQACLLHALFLSLVTLHCSCQKKNKKIPKSEWVLLFILGLK